jgi:hypothetical protein
LVIANLKWSLFVAATKKKFRKTLDWDPYYQVLEDKPSFSERLSGYAAIGHQRMASADFQEFCDRHLSHLDEIAADFFHSDAAKQAIRSKVATLYPSHEVESFTELFFERVKASYRPV